MDKNNFWTVSELDEPLIIAGRCEMAREALQIAYRNTPILQIPTGGGAAAMVHSISGGGLYRNLDRLTEDRREIRVEIRRMAEENKKLQSSGWGDEQRIAHPVLGGQCQCGEQGCQSPRQRGDKRWRSPNRGWREQEAEGGPGGKQDYKASFGDRTPSPTWRDPRPTRGSFQDDSQRRRGVRFLSPKREDPANRSGKEM